MSDSDVTPPNGWNQLHPLHPSNLGRVEADVAQMFDGLVMQYGTLIAHRIWNEAAARHPRAKAKGRPKGSRTRDHWLDQRDASRVLHAIANDPENVGLSRWQVLTARRRCWTPAISKNNGPRPKLNAAHRRPTR